jgi:hypothetical protein
MRRVRLLVGTRKGAFLLTSDGKRKDWLVSGPHFAGWEIYHLKGSQSRPRSPLCLASMPLRPLAGLARWFNGRMMAALPGMPLGNKFIYEGEAGTHQWYDGTAHPWESKRV